MAELLQVEPTTRCNFTCGFCCGRSMDQGDLPFELFERVLDLAPAVRHIELQGEGEPFLHPRLFDMIALARGRNIEISLITNGSHFTDRNIERILQYGLSKILVSMESPEAAEFQAIRGGKLEKVLRGTAALMAARRSAGLTLPAVGLSLTVLKSTEHRLPRIFELYDELGLDGGVVIQLLQRQPAYVACYSKDWLAEMFDEEEAARLSAHLSSDQVVGAIASQSSDVLGFQDLLFAGWEAETRTCPWLENGGYINKDGFVTGCCTIKDSRHAFGRIGVHSASAIEAARGTMRSQLRNGVVPEACEGCRIAEAVVGAAAGRSSHTRATASPPKPDVDAAGAPLVALRVRP